MKTRDLFLIFVLALVIRLVFAEQWAHLPFGWIPYLDAHSYDQWARAIAAGEWTRATAFYQSPLYPYFLAFIYKLFGTSAFLISSVQAVLDSCTCVFLSVFAGQAFGRRAGVFTGILAAAYGPMIFYSAPLMKETIGLFCLAGFLLIWQRGRTQWAAGILLGLAILVRTNLIFVLALIFLRSLWRRPVAWQVVLGVVLVLLPVTVHNRVQSGDWILVNSAGGFNFYIGHWREATGGNSYPPEVSTDPDKEEADTYRLAAEALNHTPSPGEVSDYWQRQAWDAISENPLNELALLWNKFVLYWNNYEPPDNYDQSFIAREFSTVLAWPWLGFGALCALAALAVGVVGTSELWLMSAVYFGSVILFYVTDRYRLPAVIFLLPLAGIGMSATWTRWRQKQWPKIFGALALAAVVVVICFHPVLNPRALDSYNWGLVTTLASEAGGHDVEAAQAIEKASSLTPLNLTARALIRGAEAYERLGDFNHAEGFFREATKLFPKDGLTFHNLGRFLLDRARLQDARSEFLTSIRVAPWNYQPYVGLMVTDQKLGERAEAAWAEQQAARLRSINKPAQ
jgi:tetratricopeptide (TPR) repeat protein